MTSTHKCLFGAKVYTLSSTEKRVEQQNSEFHSMEMSEPGLKENRQRSHTCKDL